MRSRHYILRDLLKTGMVFIFTCLLVFSMMPQKSLHNIFAEHKDIETCPIHKILPIDQVESSQKHCQVDHLVVALPFLQTSSLTIALQEVFYPKNFTLYNTKYIPCFLQIIDSRGPPNYV